MLDYHAGESFMRFYATDKDGKVVGSIKYTIFQDVISIQFIKTAESERRKGIAILMAKELQRLYPNMEIKWGFLSKDGEQFLSKLPRTYNKNQRYEEITSKLDTLRRQLAMLDRMFDRWHTLFDTNRSESERLRPQIAKYTDTYSRISDEIWNLERELIPMSKGSWKININEMEDYHHSMDYDEDFRPPKKVEDAINGILKQTKQLQDALGFHSVRIGYIRSDDKDALARYINGTMDNPYFVISARTLLKAAKKYGMNLWTAVETTLVHEFGHAYLEMCGIDTKHHDEDIVEEFAREYNNFRDIQDSKKILDDYVESNPIDETYISSIKLIPIFRGESVYNKGGNFWTTDKKFAREFTQSGLDREIIKRKIDPRVIYKQTHFQEPQVN